MPAIVTRTKSIKSDLSCLPPCCEPCCGISCCSRMWSCDGICLIQSHDTCWLHAPLMTLPLYQRRHMLGLCTRAHRCVALILLYYTLLFPPISPVSVVESRGNFRLYQAKQTNFIVLYLYIIKNPGRHHRMVTAHYMVIFPI